LVFEGDGLDLDIAKPAHAGWQFLATGRKRAGQEAWDLRDRTARLNEFDEEYEQTDSRDHSGEVAHSNAFPRPGPRGPMPLKLANLLSREVAQIIAARSPARFRDSDFALASTE
jgi:hypothetical protein